jgi:predicted nuclease of predicted toxin-antitoxin system
MAANQDTSKKQSGASLRLPPEDCPGPKEIKGVLTNTPEWWVFFVDRSLGRKIIPDTLRAAGEEVRVHDEHFPQDAKDEVWLAEAGRQGWVVLTKDKNIRYRAIELQALLAAKVRAFVLTARGDLSGVEVGQIFVKALPAMKKLCASTKPPFIARVSRDGSVSLVRK